MPHTETVFDDRFLTGHNFRSKMLTPEMLIYKLPLIVIERCIVNRQIGVNVKDSKYVAVSDP